jgi:hypothetical protein
MEPYRDKKVVGVFVARFSCTSLKKLFIETGYSKVGSYKIHWMILWVTCIPLICLKPKSIKSVVIPVEFVPETIYIKIS